MLNPIVVDTSGVGDSQGWDLMEFHLVAAAAGTEHALIAPQQTAAARVWTLTGNASASMTAARSKQVATSANAVLGTDQTLTAAQLVTYFTAVPAAADAAFCFGFAVGGIKVGEVMKVSLQVNSVSTSGINTCRELKWNTAALTRVLPTDTAPTYGTSTLCQSGNVLFGALAVDDVTDAPASGERMILRIWMRG